MRTISITLPLLTLCALLPNCAQLGQSGNSRLTAADIVALEALEDLPTGRAVKIQTRFSDGAEQLAAPSVTARSGQTAAIELATEEVYPTRYSLAKSTAESTTGNGNVFPVTPATPDDFTEAPTGLSLECTPEIVGGFIEISGRVVVRWKESTSDKASVGEGIGTIFSNDKRIVVTENRHDLPVFGSRATPFFVRALPGKTYTLIVRGEKGPINIDITAELLAPDRGELATALRPVKGAAPLLLAAVE